MGKEADHREWEHWLILVGACMASGIQREKIFKQIEPSDCPYPQVANILAALKDGTAENIQREVKSFYFLDGVDTSDGIINGIVGRVKSTAAKRNRILKAEQELAKAWNA